MLPDQFRKRSTAWVRGDDHRSSSVRYAVGTDSLYCFRRDGLDDLAAGRRVHVTLHELHDGAPIVGFDATVSDVTPGELSLGLLADMMGNRNHEESWDEIRSWPIVALRS